MRQRLFGRQGAHYQLVCSKIGFNLLDFLANGVKMTFSDVWPLMLEWKWDCPTLKMYLKLVHGDELDLNRMALVLKVLNNPCMFERSHSYISKPSPNQCESIGL